MYKSASDIEMCYCMDFCSCPSSSASIDDKLHLQAAESLGGQEAEDDYDLFAITQSMDWCDEDRTAVPCERTLKLDEPEFSLSPVPLGHSYLPSVSEDHHSCSETSIAPIHHLAGSTYILNSATANDAILPCGASPAAHLLGRDTSGTTAVVTSAGQLRSPIDGEKVLPNNFQMTWNLWGQI